MQCARSFAKTMSIESGVRLKLLDTRAASYCAAAGVPGVFVPPIFEVES